MAKGTVFVNLRRDWFGPNGTRYEAARNPHEFPASWADEPSKEQKEQNKKQRYAVLPSTAELIEGGTTVLTERLSGDGTPVADPQVVEDGVKSVGNTVTEMPEANHGEDKTHKSTSTAAAGKAAKEAGAQVGGKPDNSGPLSGKK